MPHVIIKLLPGRTEEQKLEISKRITDVLVEVAITKPGNVSVAFEDVSGEDWTEQVTIPFLHGKSETICKWPDHLLKKED